MVSLKRYPDTNLNTKTEMPNRVLPSVLEELSSLLFPQLSLEGVFGAVAGLGKIAVGAVLHRIGIAMAELVFHGVVAGLAAFVGFLGTFPAVGIIFEMVADTFRHGRPFNGCVDQRMIPDLGYALCRQGAISRSWNCTCKLL